MNPPQARDTVVAVLRRALHGPTALDDTRWPGNDRLPMTVEPDQILPDWKSLNEALIDPDGQEVLAYPPTRIYGVGVIYPRLTEDDEEALTVEQEQDLDLIPGDAAPTPDIPDPEPVSGDAEDTVRVPDGGTRPRSIALSFHTPHTADEISVTVTGGRYRPLPVAVAGSPFTLWRRTPIEHTLTVDPAMTESHTIDDDGLVLNIGVDSRPVATGRLVTVYVANMSESAGDIAGHCLFQASIRVSSAEVLAYPSITGTTAVDDATFDLLYRNHPVMAVSHGTDAVAEEQGTGWTVRTETFPVVRLPATTPDITDANGTSYSVGMRDLADLSPRAADAIERLITDYEAWIEAQRTLAQTITDPRLQAAAEANLRDCEGFLADIVAGWAFVQADPDVSRCLQWTSHVMNDQRTASSARTRPTTLTKTRTERTESVEGTNPHLGASTAQAYWRPFQIAFLLASLPQAVDPMHPRRDNVDIIWMPTGGGKTEAYLGLAAFTMLWLRAKRVADSAPLTPSVDVLMRYTLRLLTAQQVQRASALICAMEVLRKRVPALLGDRPFRIGAYLGRATTPNSRKDAVTLWNLLESGKPAHRTDRSFLLTRCPWCGAQMGAVDNGIVGYRKSPVPGTGDNRVAAFCPAYDCPFTYTGDGAKFAGLPVLEVDEDIYLQPPSFVVGTIDKFAQLSWKDRSRSLFGLVASGSGLVQRRADPPALMIQDELHLIAGPLGSLDALYEITLQHLCEYDGGRKPRIIAATATTRNYAGQVRRLYGRTQARLIPPPSLDVDDSFFARVDPDRPGKSYVAVCAPGFGSNVQSQMRTLAALLHAAGTLDVTGADPDPWWTNLAFFSSRRSLGLQLSATQTGLESAVYALSQISGLRVGRLTEKGTRHARRSIGQVKELTATSRDNVTDLLAQLAIEKDRPGCIDICFATSMIEVGVDVSRLGLMTVMGQPKSYSQYIQVTGRVGRTDNAPGVVVVVLSPHTVRDRSHYETFTASHRRLYASVEPVSITPFTPQALERGLAGALTGVLRTTTDFDDPSALLTEKSLRERLTPWMERASRLEGDRASRNVEEEANRLIRLGHAAVATNPYLDWDGYGHRADHPFLLPLGDASDTTTQTRWQVPLSMRSVDSESGVVIPLGIAPLGSRPSGTTGSDEAEEF